MPADHHQHHGARLKREMCACVCVCGIVETLSATILLPKRRRALPSLAEFVQQLSC